MKMRSIVPFVLAIVILHPLFADQQPTPLSEESSVGKNPLIVADASPAFHFAGQNASSYGVFAFEPFILGDRPPKSTGPGLHIDQAKYFYIYSDYHYPFNHFTPSGWMGDTNDIRIDDASREDPADGATCIKIQYSAKVSDGRGWAGIYWQEPQNNWGDKKGGFDLSSMKRLTFWARGAKGGEEIAVFRVGGIDGIHHDSGASRIGPVTLSREWTHYVIDLSDADLSKISGGFSWGASQINNPDGMTFYLDEIRFEK